MKRRLSFVSILLAVCLGALIYFRFPLSALLWNLRNGRDLSWNGCSMTLPLLWSPSSDSNTATLSIRRAVTSGMSSELIFRRRNESLESADQAARWQKTTVDTLNSKRSSAPAYQPYTVVTARGDVFCIDSGKEGLTGGFVCKVVGEPFDVGFVGKTVDELDARAILSTLR